MLRQSIRKFSTNAPAPEAGVKTPWDRIKEKLLFREGMTPYANYPRKAKAGKGYRYPSPGAPERGHANTPVVENEDALYNTNYYIRDTRRNQDPILVSTAQDAIASELPPNIGSAGRVNPTVQKYDPTGTRTAMTTSYKATAIEIAKHQPKHLPTSLWRQKGEEVQQVMDYAKKNNLPVGIGKGLKWTGGNDLKW